MTITSFWFLMLVAVGVAFYYVIPKKLQWMELLLLSLIFYYFAAVPYTIIYVIISTLTAYGSTMLMKQMRSREVTGKKTKQRLILFVTILALVVNIGVWFVLKGRGLWLWPATKLYEITLSPHLEAFLLSEPAVALGMGYYTLQVLGYIIDCYWETIMPQRNPLKLFLFVAYFPQMTTGPISRYAQLETLYDRHKFQYQNIAFGAQRILWGFAKKIVLAERVGILVSGITGNPGAYTGLYSWIAVLLYPLQMYADFSGCMDIILGVSELFDVHLTENFRNPFFAVTSQEFWQRWHITLGSWAKDYVLYPLLKSPLMVKLGKWGKKRFGKKVGKFLANAVGMFVLWMVMGIWHGGIRYIVGVSLWYWVVLMLGDLFAPVFKRITEGLHMKTESFSWRLFQCGRTYLIYAVGATFFSLGVKEGLAILRDMAGGDKNPWIFFNGSILNLGISHMDINIMLIMVLLLFIVAYLREKYGYARIWIQNQSFPFRWFIWIGLFVFVLIYGKYGPGYDAAEFIYQGF